MKIGLSYNQGTLSYDRYRTAVVTAARQADSDVEPVWLAGPGGVDHAALDGIDGLLLTGGADVEPHRYGFADPDGVCKTYPGRDAAEWAILDSAFSRRLPILAICRGMQLLNVYRGGALVPDLPGHRVEGGDILHPVVCEPGSALSMLVGQRRGRINSSHHQAVATPGHGLQVAARDPDGVIEAIEWINPARKPWLAAVQWHPERMNSNEPFAGTLFRGFLQAAALARV